MKIKEVIGSLTAKATQPKPVAAPKPPTATTPVQAKNNADKTRLAEAGSTLTGGDSVCMRCNLL